MKKATKNTQRLETIELPSPAAGTTITLDFYHYGEAGRGPKAYIHAALHADEIPGLLVARKLIAMIADADSRGEIAGSILIAPVANPLGLNQFFHGRLQGRFFTESGKNFNREFPEISGPIAQRVSEQLTNDAAHNVDLIRAAAREILAATIPLDALGFLRHALFSRSVDADYVLDLHCDDEANLYFYTLPELWQDFRDLAAFMRCESVLLAEADPSIPFDEANSALWQRLAQRFPEHPIPLACKSTTLELRGDRDVDDETAHRDALGIFQYLQSRGVIAGDAPPVPELECEATPFSGVGQVIARHAGIVSFFREPGEVVSKGELLANLTPLEPFSPATELIAPVSGVMYSRTRERYAYSGKVVCEVAGRAPLNENAGKSLLSN
ncbi:MAG: succinylglutamate desuccinylase/aspartoacylase family protein [Pseudomonadota bacterium]